MEAVFAGGPTFILYNTYAPGRYLMKTPEVEAQLYEIVFGSAPAVNGSYSINFGFRDQGIVMAVAYAAATEADVMNLWLNDAPTMIGPFDFTLNGKTFKRCFIDAKASHNTDIKKQIVNAVGEVWSMGALIKIQSKGAAQ